jgi:YD repeat-containing protein
MASGRAGGVGGVKLGAWLLAVGCGLLALAGGARAGASVETRDFIVHVDGKRAGDVHMTVTRQEDGSTTMQCDTDIKISFLLKTYVYSYRGFELWKDGRLQRFNSTCEDDGKVCRVVAAADGDDLKLRVDGRERKVRGDVWLSSYWAQPDKKMIDASVPLLEADTGKVMDVKVQFVAVERRGVLGSTVNVNHFRLSGGAQVELWYDGDGRLVRQEWTEEGKRIVMDLSRLRR